MLNHQSVGTRGLCRALGVATLAILGMASCGGGSGGGGSGTTTSSSSTVSGSGSVSGPSAGAVYTGCAAPTTPRHIYYSDPVNGSMANDGSQAHPWAGLSAMVAAGKLPPATGATVVAGDQIMLLSGDHGSLSLNNAANSDFISIQAAPGQTPVLRGITMYGGAHWAFNGLTIQNLNNGNYTFGVRYAGDDFIFTNGTVLSQPDVSAWTQADWRQKALYQGVNGQGNCIAITNNTIRNVGFAVGVGGSNVLVRGNTIDHFGDDGIDFAQGTGTGTISNVEISRNTITNNLNIGDSNHNDGIQGWVLNGTTGTNVLIDGNLVINQTDPTLPWAGTMQGISEFDGAWDGIQISNNVVIAAAYHGISLYGAHNATIINNTVFGNYVATNGDVNETWIGVFNNKDSSPPVNLVVRNNISSMYSLVGTGVTSDHNVLTTNPQANFVQFNRATFQYDLRPAPGCVQLGYGSTQLAPAYDITGAQRVPPITAGAYQ
jgi:parallel beta-helix repeat protein